MFIQPPSLQELKTTKGSSVSRNREKGLVAQAAHKGDFSKQSIKNHKNSSKSRSSRKDSDIKHSTNKDISQEHHINLTAVQEIEDL